jgi:RND superfamily putative drug exporter
VTTSVRRVSDHRPSPRSDRSQLEVGTQPTGLAGLGVWSATHLRTVLVLWLLVLAGFGAFAASVETALSGAGWEDSGSQSARDVIAKNFQGLGATALQVVVHDGSGPIAKDPAAQRIVARTAALLTADPRLSTVVGLRPGMSLSKDGRTAVVQGGAGADANAMVRAADDLTGLCGSWPRRRCR